MSKTQLSVFLEPQVLQAAKQRAAEMKLSMSAVVAEAAKESLLSSYRSERELEILKAVERNFHSVRRLDQRLAIELAVLKEMVGLGMRSFFNHTTPIPDGGKSAALLSGKHRFHTYLDMLAKNLRKGDSILSDLPMPDLNEPGESDTLARQPASEAVPIEPIERPASRPVTGRSSHRAPAQPVLASGHKDQTPWGLFEQRAET
jgi:hypothetical protein